jgi:sterol desaturase/sphingolipid hydroxylase (fatty acid hydroxylase superfamily)
MGMDNWMSTISVIVFMLLAVSEAVVSRREHLELFDRLDTWANIAMGLVTFATKIGINLLSLLLYTYVWDSGYVLWKPDMNIVVWFLVGLLVNDFLFYWYHRISHVTRFFWAVHVAHHSSEKLNITTAIRGNFVNNIFHGLFWLPMVLLGFSPWIVITTDAFSYFYQLWLHTRIIPKLGPIEWFMNTPSHHRVHHASNPKYIDKNFAAVFMFWDKLFGTFEEEAEPVRFGLTKPFKSYNPIKIAFHEFGEVFRDSAAQPSWRAKWRELWRRP